MAKIIVAHICIMLLAACLVADETAPKDKSLIVRKTEKTIVCKDADGAETELNKFPKRTVICYTSFVGLWHLAGGSAVGMVDTMYKTNLPEPCRELTTVGGFANPNAERILSLKPDFVILTARAEKQRALKTMLKERGIQCIALDYENYGDFRSLLQLFMELNDKKSGDNPLEAKIVAEVNTLIEKAAKLKGPRFIVLAASADISREDPNSNTSRIASLLGGKNICQNGRGAEKYSLEKLVMEDPDLILFTTKSDTAKIEEKMKAELFSNPAWQRLRAAQSGRVFFLPPFLFVFKANEKFPDAFRHMAKLLYPNEQWD